MAPITVGFLGLGIMGTAMARNLLKSGQFARVVVWNRTLAKCDELVAEGAVAAKTPGEVAAQCDITFGMLADPEAALAAVFSEGGVLSGIGGGRGYVDMSTVDEHTSTQIYAAITEKGGAALEAPVSGSKKPAIDGQLVIMAAGDEALYAAALPAFGVMGKKSFYLGAVGAAARMKLIVNAIMGAMMGAFCEGMALTERSGLEQSALLEILSLGAIANPMFALKGPALVAHSYPPAFPLKHQQKDLRLALALGDALNQPTPIIAAANERYKEAKAQGHGDEDFAAVYEAINTQPQSSSS